MKLEEIFTFENLYEAYKNCRKSKQHKSEVVRFESNLSENLYKIMKEMETKKYKLGQYINFKIYEPKERLIEAPTFKDRVIIRCFCDVFLKLKIEKRLIYDNAACRKGKGTSFSINRLEKFLKREYLHKKDNNIYFLKCDIRKYFPSINHEILIDLLKGIDFSDDEMWLIQKLIKEQPDSSNIGLPLGNQSSQWFALFYLNKIDRYIKEDLRVKSYVRYMDDMILIHRVKSYVRYMDDMILIHRDKTFLRYCKIKIEDKCNSLLKLSLNQKTQIGKVKDGIDFLGYRHILNANGSITRKLRVSSKQRIKKHLKTLEKLRNKDVVDDEYVSIRKKAYYNNVKNTNESLIFKNSIINNKNTKFKYK